MEMVVTKIIFHLKKDNFLLLLLLKKPFNWYSLKKIKNISNDRMCFELIKNISWRYYRQQFKFKFRNYAGLPVVFGELPSLPVLFADLPTWKLFISV